jgi:cytochrome c oxidase subunit 2
VIAEQFAWNVHYPGADGQFGKTDINLVTSDNPIGLDRTEANAKDDIVTINQLNLPVGKPVIIQLTSKDVIHSLGIPLLRVKQDAIPGQVIPVWFKPVETTAEIRAKLTRTFALGEGHDPRLAALVAMEDYIGKDSTVIAAKGSMLSEDVLTQLSEAGYKEVKAGPDTPMEIACSQLCGLGHYRMRGYVSILTPEEFEAWLKEESSYLTP